jgi:Phage integrase family
VDAYVLFEEQRGRITVADNPTEAMRAQLADWWHATEQHREEESVLVALRRSSVAELNANAHTLMRDAGRLGDHEVSATDRTFAPGDRVVLLRNSTALDVDNGDRGTITAVEPESRGLTVELDAGREVRLPGWYLDAGWVDYGYALTAHKLQSTTVDRTFALATDDLYQEAGYSIATRARHETHFYLAAQPELADREHAHGPPQPPDDAISRFARHLSASRAQTLASDEPAHRTWMERTGHDVTANACVFQGSGGTPIRPDGVRRLLRTLAARTNKRRGIAGLNPLPRVTPHTLRRTYISIMLLASSGDVEYVMAQVGHADAETTMRIYAQLLKRAKRAHGTAFDTLVNEARDAVLGSAPQPTRAASL